MRVESGRQKLRRGSPAIGDSRMIFAPLRAFQMARRISDPGLRFYTRFGCLPSATAAEQIDRGTQLKQGIIGRLDSVHAEDGIEDDLFLLMRIVRDRIRKNDLS